MNTITKSPTIPTTITQAVNFALDCLEPFEMAEFLSDFRAGKDITPWLDAWHLDRQAA